MLTENIEQFDSDTALKLLLGELNIEELTMQNTRSLTENIRETKYENTTSLDISFYKKKQYNIIRRQMLLLFSEIYGKFDQFKILKRSDKLNIIKLSERSVYNSTINKAEEFDMRADWGNELFVKFYRTNSYKVLSNLDPDSIIASRKLGCAVLEGIIAPSRLGHMSSQELSSNMYSEDMKKIEERKQIIPSIKSSKLYECDNCHGTSCNVESYMNRGADEGINLLIRCLICGYQQFG